ncbi:MAG: NUDIX domain-containing protein [Blautia wexlerae]
MQKESPIEQPTYGLFWKRKAECRFLLQKRSQNKDSFQENLILPRQDHIQAGDEPLESALRELKEELGISAATGTATLCRNLPHILRKGIPWKNVSG